MGDIREADNAPYDGDMHRFGEIQLLNTLNPNLLNTLNSLTLNPSFLTLSPYTLKPDCAGVRKARV